MAISGNYSIRAVATTFISTFSYIILFVLFKYFEWDWLAVFWNLSYAVFVIWTVWLDRKNRFRSIDDAKLVTLGTALSAFAVATLDILFNLISHPVSGNWVMALVFLFISALLQLGLFVLAWFIPVKKNQPSGTTTSQ